MRKQDELFDLSLEPVEDKSRWSYFDIPTYLHDYESCYSKEDFEFRDAVLKSRQASSIDERYLTTHLHWFDEDNHVAFQEVNLHRWFTSPRLSPRDRITQDSFQASMIDYQDLSLHSLYDLEVHLANYLSRRNEQQTKQINSPQNFYYLDLMHIVHALAIDANLERVEENLIGLNKYIHAVETSLPMDIRSRQDRIFLSNVRQFIKQKVDAEVSMIQNARMLPQHLQQAIQKTKNTIQDWQLLVHYSLSDTKLPKHPHSITDKNAFISDSEHYPIRALTKCAQGTKIEGDNTALARKDRPTSLQFFKPSPSGWQANAELTQSCKSMNLMAASSYEERALYVQAVQKLNRLADAVDLMEVLSKKLTNIGQISAAMLYKQELTRFIKAIEMELTETQSIMQSLSANNERHYNAELKKGRRMNKQFVANQDTYWKLKDFRRGKLITHMETALEALSTIAQQLNYLTDHFASEKARTEFLDGLSSLQQNLKSFCNEMALEASDPGRDSQVKNTLGSPQQNGDAELSTSDIWHDPIATPKVETVNAQQENDVPYKVSPSGRKLLSIDDLETEPFALSASPKQDNPMAKDPQLALVDTLPYPQESEGISCFNASYGEQQTPFLVCPGPEGLRMVFSKKPLDGYWPQDLNTDHYNLSSCKSVSFHGQSAMVCDGEQTQLIVVFKPHPMATISTQLGSQLALSLVLGKLAVDSFAYVRSWFKPQEYIEFDPISEEKYTQYFQNNVLNLDDIERKISHKSAKLKRLELLYQKSPDEKLLNKVKSLGQDIRYLRFSLEDFWDSLKAMHARFNDAKQRAALSFEEVSELHQDIHYFKASLDKVDTLALQDWRLKQKQKLFDYLQTDESCLSSWLKWVEGTRDFLGTQTLTLSHKRHFDQLKTLMPHSIRLKQLLDGLQHFVELNTLSAPVYVSDLIDYEERWQQIKLQTQNAELERSPLLADASCQDMLDALSKHVLNPAIENKPSSGLSSRLSDASGLFYLPASQGLPEPVIQTAGSRAYFDMRFKRF